MALAKMTFDELNALVGYKVSEPIDEYYEPMRITEEQKEKRMDLAYDLEIVMIGLLSSAFYADQYNTVLTEDVIREAVQGYIAAVVTSEIEPDEYLGIRAEERVADIVGQIYKHPEKLFNYSLDRARAIAENESNAIWGYSEYSEAVMGKMFKTWRTIMDGHERNSHAEVNGVTLPINEPFELQGGYVQFPGDDSLGVSDEELVNCRCSLSFS